MGQSRHVVRVSDPWFGTYLLCTEQIQGAQILIGPLFERVLRVETLSNQGLTHKIGESLEKPCQHHYVEGSITGNLPDGVWPKDCMHFWLGLSGGEDSQELYYFDGALLSQCSVSCASSLCPTETVCTLDLAVDFKSIRTVDNYVCNRYQSWITIDLVRTENPDHSVAYTLSQYSSTCDPLDVHVWSVAQVSCPFGSGGDNLLRMPGVIGQLSDTLEQQVEIAGRHVSVRDAAIYDALDNISVAAFNPLEDAADLMDVLAPLKQLAALVKVRGFMDIIKALASMHLFYKYVVKTGILNAQEWSKLLRALQHPMDFIHKVRESGIIGHGRKVVERSLDDTLTIKVTETAKLVYETSSADVLDLLNLLGLTPRLADLWDIVPFSFVVDWCLPIGDALNNLELNNIQQRFPFVYGVLSKKIIGTYTRQFQAGSHSYNLSLTIVDYVREVIDEFPTDVWFGVAFGDPRKQLLTGGALAIQVVS